MNTNIWLAIIVLAIVMSAMIVLKPADAAPFAASADGPRSAHPRFHVVWSHDSQGWHWPIVSADR
ncbi:MAG: hypothetical protein U0768_10470 [Anaerolineae bacterium]